MAAQLEFVVGTLKELRTPQPGKEQYYAVCDTAQFYIWPDAEFLQSLLPGVCYNWGYEARGKYKTARSTEVIQNPQPYPNPAPGPAPINYNPPQPLPQQYQQAQQYQPAPQMPQQAPYQPPQPQYQPPSPIAALDPREDHSMMMYVTGVVGRAMGSGSFPANEIILLTAEAIKSWHSIPQFVRDAERGSSDTVAAPTAPEYPAPGSSLPPPHTEHP